MTLTVTDLRLDQVHIDEDLDFRSDKETGIDELAASIEAHGLMQPIIVADANGDGLHSVIAGRRRLRAYQALGRNEIPAIIRSDMSDLKGQVVGQIIENLQRQDISVVDEARSYAQLGDWDMKQKDIAAACGVSPAHVSGRLALLKLPADVLAKVQEGRLPLDFATRLARASATVRNIVLEGGNLTEWALSDAERKVEAEKQLSKMAAEIAARVDVPVAHATIGGGYVSTDQVATEYLGLTDEDKPKSHEWDVAGRFHRADFETEEAFYDAVADVKAKGYFVQQHGSVILIDSANLDKERKAHQEEQRRIAEEREAAAAARQEAFDSALAPLIESPDKSKVLAFMLTEYVNELLDGWFPQGRLVRFATRLGYEGTDDDEAAVFLKAKAASNLTDAVRVLLALQDVVSPLLAHLGFLDNYPVDLLPDFLQADYAEQGLIDRASISEAAESILSIRREQVTEAEDEYDEYDVEDEADLEPTADGGEEE